MRDTAARLRRKADRILRNRTPGAGGSDDSEIVRLLAELEAREEELRQLRQVEEQAQKRYRELHEFGPWGCIRTDRHSVVSWANGTALKALSLQIAELEGKHFAHLVYRADQSRCLHLLSQIATGRRQSESTELRLLKRLEQPLYVQMEVRAFLEAGRFNGWQMTFLDIDRQKRLENELRRSKDKYSSIFRAARDAIIVFDTVSGRLLEANPCACKLYGYKAEEMLQLRHLDLTTRPDQALQAVAMERASIPACDHKRKDGSVFPVEISISYFDQRGHRLSTMVIRDITRRQQTEERLRENNAALKTLLRQREEDRAELERSLLDNVQHLVLPYVEKLQNSRLPETQRFYVEMLASHLQEITSPFVRQLSSQFLGLTPTELRIADLIRQGRTSKEIAQNLVTSERAVLFHRQNLRKKLGIRQKKVNLQTYLAKLSR